MQVLQNGANSLCSNLRLPPITGDPLFFERERIQNEMDEASRLDVDGENPDNTEASAWSAEEFHNASEDAGNAAEDVEPVRATSETGDVSTEATAVQGGDEPKAERASADADA